MAQDQGELTGCKKADQPNMRFLPQLSLTNARWHYCVAGLLPNGGDQDTLLIFFEILQNCYVFFRIHSGFIPTFLEIPGQYASTILKWRAQNFFCGTVEMKFFRLWLTFVMPNLSVFFQRRGDIKNLRFITCDDTQNHCWITCQLCQKSPGCVDFHLFIFVSQLFGYSSCAHFCIILNGQNMWYRHVRNVDNEFIDQQIPNFTNCVFDHI